MVRYKYYYFFQKYIGNGKDKKSLVFRLINKISIIIQKLARVDRLDYQDKHAAGSQWFSITAGFAKYILDHKEDIERKYKYGVCVDEVFIQNLLFNSSYVNNLFHDHQLNNISGNFRLIDWKRGNPYIWKMEDKKNLLNSPCLFARKFDQTVDEKIITWIHNNIGD